LSDIRSATAAFLWCSTLVTAVRGHQLCVCRNEVQRNDTVVCQTEREIPVFDPTWGL